MATLRTMTLYTMADVFGMRLRRNKKTGMITGEVARDVFPGGIPLTVKLRVRSSITNDSFYGLIVSAIGNMGMLLAAPAGRTEMQLYVLNLAKMSRFDGWFEEKRPRTIQEALNVLGKAVVRSFIMGSDKTWTLAE